MQKLINRETEINKTRLDLTNKIWLKVSSAKRESPLIASYTRMTQHALSALACSLLLPDEENQGLLFKFASGPVGKQVSPLKISKQSGIAGWVARTGKPLMVNDVAKDKRFYKFIDEVTGFVTKSVICAPLIINLKVTGVIEVLNKLDGSDFSEKDLQLLIEIAITAAMAIENARLNQSMRDSHKSAINALVSAVDARDACASGHSRRVSYYALMGATTLSLSKEDRQIIERAAILHDIGKLGIPDSILNKSDALTNEEWQIIRRHPVLGSNIVRGIPSHQEVSKLVLSHHEGYDGKGYPQGLRGEAIPIGARLIAVADAFDNMTTERSYRNALSKKDALTELRRCVGSQFCPVAVKAFCSGFVKFHLSSKI